jgi:hypothetical protein
MVTSKESVEFRTPVRRLEATVTFASGDSQDVVLFCPPGEDIARMLAATEPFLPIEQNGRVRLIARKTLAVITTRVGHDFDEEGTLTRRTTVTVRLTSGGKVDGDLAYSPRPGRPRVLDFLNEPDAMLRLWGPNAVHHVSKEHIDSVEEQ